MEKLEIAANVTSEAFSLRCKGWCHDAPESVVQYDSIPSTEYFE